MDYTTDELINIIKIYGAVPAQQPAYSNSNLLKLINREYYTVIVPKLILLNEEYFVTYSDTTISGTSLTVDIPTKAIGTKLREIKIVDGDDIENVPVLDIDTSSSANDFGVLIRGNQVILQDADDYTGQSLRLYYYERPNELVLTTSAGKIKTDSGSAYTITTVPSTFSTGLSYDIIKSTPPFKKIIDNQVCTLVSDVLTPTTYVASTVGDYVALTGQSPIVQLPAEWFELLAQSVVVKIMESQGDGQGLQMAAQRYMMLDKIATDLVSMRVKGEPRKFIRKNSLFGL